jgi:hypothetical protein
MKTLKKAIKVGVVGCGYWDPKLDPQLAAVAGLPAQSHW